MSNPNTNFPNGAPAFIKAASRTVTDDLDMTLNSVSSTLTAVDCAEFQSITVQLISINNAPWTGAVVFEVSNDGVIWNQAILIDRNGGGRAGGIGPGTLGVNTSAGVFVGTIGARYIRARQSAYTTGQIRINAILSAATAAPITLQTTSLTAADNNIGRVSMQTLTESGSLAAGNAIAGGVVDLSMMSQVQVQITGTWSGFIVWEASVDGTNWVTKILPNITDLNRASAISSNGIWFGQLGARYFRARMQTYTSGTAVVTIRYTAAASDMPIGNMTTQARAWANSDSTSAVTVDLQGMGAYNGSSIDRLRNASGFTSALSGMGLAVANGLQPYVTINAGTSPTVGTVLDGTTARPTHTLQADTTTTAVGTGGNHVVQLQASLDGTYWFGIGTTTLNSTSTTATDGSNHGVVSIANQPWRYTRAQWLSIPTSWTGTMTVRIVSA